LAYKALFAAGLLVILLLGGAISTLAGVLIQRVEEPPRVVAPPIASSPVETPTPVLRSLGVQVSGPSVAVVTIDGERVETKSGLSNFTTLTTGDAHKLKVEAPNWQTYEGEFVLAIETTSPMKVTLQPRMGQIEVISDPPGAAITLNARKIAAPTPATISGLPRTAEYEVHLALEGHEPWTMRLVWASNDRDRKKVEVRMTAIPVAEAPAVAPARADKKPDAASRAATKREARKERDRLRREREKRITDRRSRPPGLGSNGPPKSSSFGYLSVGAKPYGTVSVDGRLVASETPLRRHRLSTGYHTVTVKFPTLGGRKRTRRVFVKPGGQHNMVFTP
jgi:hypothetical protein